MYTAYMALRSGCTGRRQGEQESPRATPGPLAPTRRPPGSWSRLMGDLYGTEHGPSGRGSRAPRFRVLRLRSAAEARGPRGTQRPLAAGGSLAAPLLGSASSAPKIQLSGDPGSHCGGCRAGWKPDGGWAAQGWLVRTCPPPGSQNGVTAEGLSRRKRRGLRRPAGWGSSAEAGGAETPRAQTRAELGPGGCRKRGGARLAQGQESFLEASCPVPGQRCPRRTTPDTSTRRRAHDAGPWSASLRAPPPRTPFRPSCPLLSPQAW